MCDPVTAAIAVGVTTVASTAANVVAQSKAASAQANPQMLPGGVIVNAGDFLACDDGMGGSGDHRAGMRKHAAV